MQNKKTHLINLVRKRIPENRDLNNGLRLDRNEKVSNWDKKIVNKIFSNLPEYFLSIYPDLSNIYKKIAKFDSVKEENILISSGIDGGIKTLFEVCTNHGDLVGVVSPTYAMYKVYSKIFNTKIFEIEYTDKFEFNYSKYYDFLKLKPKILFLPNPNQPVESNFSIKELKKIAEETKKNDCILFVDEAYYLFGSDTAIELIKDFDNLIIGRTFSKAFGVPSIRLGYLISNEENISILSKTRFAHESNSLSNAIAEYLLDNLEIVKEYNRAIIESREKLKEDISKMGFKAYGNFGNYLLIDFQSEELAKKVVNQLKEKLIYVKGSWQNKWAKCITISVGPYDTMKKFISALNKILSSK